jgi:hypothetical protein
MPSEAKPNFEMQQFFRQQGIFDLCINPINIVKRFGKRTKKINLLQVC